MAAGSAAIAYVTHLERNNQFCVACHRPDGERLHGQLFARYESKPPVDLSALHHTKKAVKCIDCHGGVGVAGRSRVLAVAAWDTAKYLAGAFKEPDRMMVPLRDLDCLQCHADYNQGLFPEGGQGGGKDFHKLPEHRVLDGIRCAACHASHVVGDPRLGFINNRVVLPLCRRCHRDMGME